MRKLFVVLAFACLQFVNSVPNDIRFTTCSDGYNSPICTVDQVKVDSCEIDRMTKACILKRTSTYYMNVHFNPDFEGSDLTLLAYALLPGGVDAPFPGMDDNACTWMQCPVVKNQPQTYNFNLTLKADYPTGLFNVRWLMKKGGDPTCCFQNKFKIE